ncbi:MAG: hypothetical protein GMKNLPBB_01973 [Myxococcota bacterium]|nr:hypothetical protein [Myxococcota bacterium]
MSNGQDSSSPPDDRGGRFGKGVVPELLKKTVTSGLDAVLGQEETIRGLLGEMKLGREAMQFLAMQSERTRREVLRVVADEVHGFLESSHLTDEAIRLLTSLKFEIKTEVRFSRADDTVKPEVKSGLKVSRAGAPPEPFDPPVSVTRGPPESRTSSRTQEPVGGGEDDPSGPVRLRRRPRRPMRAGPKDAG